MTDPIPDTLPTPEPIEATVEPISEDTALPAPTENTFIEYGLRTPNGEVHWGAYLARPIDTPENRTIFIDVLRKTADEMGFPQDELLSRYAWRGRHVRQLDLGEVPITSEAAAPPLPEPQP